MKAITAVTKVTTAPLAKAFTTASPPATTAKPTPIPTRRTNIGIATDVYSSNAHFCN